MLQGNSFGNKQDKCISVSIPNVLLLQKTNLRFSAWEVGRCLSELKDEYKNKCNQRAKKRKRQMLSKTKKEKMPTWRALLQEKFGVMVAGDVLQWANHKMRLYDMYSEEDMQLAHMDFTTAYNMIPLLPSDRSRLLKISKEKLLTQAMLLEIGNCTHHVHALLPHEQTSTQHYYNTCPHTYTNILYAQNLRTRKKYLSNLKIGE